jgi:catechol 2,3-dioxygenase-like lactoylglutathione lyase family enzyme
VFTAAQVNVYASDVERSVAFYRGLGFAETFRTPAEGPPAHVELALGGMTLGVASVEAARADHGLDLDLARPGRGMEVAVWNDDTDAAFARLVAEGAPVLSEPHDFLGRLRVAWVADPDGNPVELVQRLGSGGR